MAATSKHYGDVSKWIENVIDSCETPLHEGTARRLVMLFEKKYQSELEFSTYEILRTNLTFKLDQKFYARIHNKIEGLEN
jgi:hypothetical protein